MINIKKYLTKTIESDKLLRGETFEIASMINIKED